MAALLEYLKHWFSSLFGTVKREFDGTVKKEEVVQKDIHECTDCEAVKPTETESVVEKEIAKDVSKILEVLGVMTDSEVKVTSDDQNEVKEEKVSEVKPCKPLHRSSKLTMDQVRLIRANSHIKNIKTIKELATEYSVSVDTIKRIIDNKTYKEC